MSVTAADLLAALQRVPEQARLIASERHRREQHRSRVADLERRAMRRSVDGACYDLGEGWYVVDLGALTLPIVEEDVEDYHGGWAK